MTPQKPSLRVLHFLQSIRLEEGGVVRAVLDLCATLAAQGHDVSLATVDAADAPAAWKSAGPASPGLPRARILSADTPLVHQIAPLVDAAEVVHLHGPWSIANLRIARVCRRFGRPYILTPHGMLDEWSMAQKRLKKRLYHAVFAKRLLEHAAFVHCTAQAELDQAQRWFPGGRGAVVPCVIDLDAYAKLPGPGKALARFPLLTPERLKLLFLSRLHHKKGVEALIDAAALLRRDGIDLAMVIAGPGEPAYVRGLQERVERLGLADRTQLPGLVRGEEKLSLYQACDLFVLPTSQENFGLVLFESMACGTPVLTTRGADTWREIASGGATIGDADPASIARSIRELAADRQALAQRGRRSREWVMGNLNVERLVSQYADLYRRARDHAAADPDAPGLPAALPAGHDDAPAPASQSASPAAPAPSSAKSSTSDSSPRPSDR